MDQSLREVLRSSGVNGGDVVELNGSALFHAVPGGSEAVALWFKLARELPRYGAWPILATDRAALAYLRHCAATYPAQDAPDQRPTDLLGNLTPRVFRKSLPACLLDREGEPLPKCWLGTVKARGTGDVPRSLGFGGVGSCPSPDRHGEMLAKWAKAYGAVPIAFKHSMMEFVVARPPATQEAALELALEQTAYAPDVARRGLGSVEKLATALVGLPYWAVWWDE